MHFQIFQISIVLSLRKFTKYENLIGSRFIYLIPAHENFAVHNPTDLHTYLMVTQVTKRLYCPSYLVIRHICKAAAIIQKAEND